jgi:hypothetical protein
MSMLKHWRTIVGLVVVFAAGLAIGGIVTLRIVHQSYLERMNPASWTPRTLAWLRSEIHIDDRQEAEIRPCVERAMHGLADLKARVDEERKGAFVAMFTEIAPQLTEPQRERLKQRLRESAAKDAASSSPGL